jgi:peptidoglycan/xylan/chitin deacetylase (PgdA/CDA1 family)/GT2 family glycosyltransferase
MSVVIATRNRRESLARCLQALGRQTQPPDSFEVVIADDGSTDGTAAMLASLRPPFRLRTVQAGGVGQATACNLAIAAAQAPVCLILDDDVMASPVLVAEHLEAHRRHERLLGIGRLTQASPHAPDWYAGMFADAWNRHFDGLGDAVDWTACYGGNMSVSRTAFIASRGFDASITGIDYELAFRLCRDGCVPVYLPRAHAVHDDQKRTARLIDDSRSQGESHVMLAEREPAMMPKLLGWFGATTRREIMLRRVLLATRINPRTLARVGPLVPGRGRQALWFEFISRLAFWRGVRRSVTRKRWIQLTHGVPVLMYHAFGDASPPSRYVLPERAFARQMRLLRALRYRTIQFDELVRCVREFRLPPPRSVVITIDDGYRDNLTVAAPILRRQRFVATIYLVSERIGGVNDWADGELHQRPLLSLDEIERLRTECFDFGAHTRTHCSLPDVPDEQLCGEIAGSRADLEERLGIEIGTFAYPFGGYDERSLAVVGEAGFVGACTTYPILVRPDADPAQIPRIEIKSSYSLLAFLVRLWFGER